MKIKQLNSPKFSYDMYNEVNICIKIEISPKLIYQTLSVSESVWTNLLAPNWRENLNLVKTSSSFSTIYNVRLRNGKQCY